MKINILFEIKDGPWGGGNQFLKSLRKEFAALGIYEESIEKADIVLFNSFQEINKVIDSKKQYKDKLFVHRVDGPISLATGRDKIVDKIIFRMNEMFADATIFQSKWSKLKSEEFGMKKNKFETIIYNSPDKSVFWKKIRGLSNDKIKLVASSWSDNPNKGFKYYQYLDETLDFNKYEMVFIGRSPIKFINIKMTGPLSSLEIAKYYRESDIYITATKDESCSNALIEALSCGLPAACLNSGGSPELVRNGGELFENKEEIEEKIELIIRKYDSYIKNIPIFDMEKTANEYRIFLKSVLDEKVNRKYPPKRLTVNEIVEIKMLMLVWLLKRIFVKIKSLLSWK